MPYLRVYLKPQISCKDSLPKQFCAILSRYKGGQDQADMSQFKTHLFTNLSKKFIMNNFNVEGDLRRHHLSIFGNHHF